MTDAKGQPKWFKLSNTGARSLTKVEIAFSILPVMLDSIRTSSSSDISSAIRGPRKVGVILVGVFRLTEPILSKGLDSMSLGDDGQVTHTGC